MQSNSEISNIQVIRRNGQVTDFDSNKISVAIGKAFLEVEGNNAETSSRIHDTAAKLTEQISTALTKRLPDGGTVHIEDIQDQVELALMRGGHQKIVRSYVLYREAHSKFRNKSDNDIPPKPTRINVTSSDGKKRRLDTDQLKEIIDDACQGLADVDSELIFNDTVHNLFDGVPEKEVINTATLTASSHIEQSPDYSFVSARLLLHSLRSEALLFTNTDCDIRSVTFNEMAELYSDYFVKYIKKGTELNLLDAELCSYNLKQLGLALLPERDLKFNYLSLRTLYDRYFIHSGKIKFELPQAFFMRVAMGLAINEVDREEKTIEFYELLSSFDFMSSTPTLFNSGTPRPQLSSCYLSTIPDDLGGIFDAIKDDALLSKFAGGLGNDWTRVRALGSEIKGTNGQSQGVVPFLKVANDTAVAVNQGGKRKGAMCAYLETWHLDIEEFLDLRKNTGDDRRRTHDMNTANWIPDLFMERVHTESDWTLFSPEETPELHDLFGKDFEEKYVEYENKADNGELVLFKRLPAITLWRKMLSMLFETGHPWITFKDPCNLRSPQQHVGVVHSSNLCTEITLNTNDDEIAVCNLGSVNLVNHVDINGTGLHGLDLKKLEKTISTAMRMLDNIIDYNYYSVPQARRSNLLHRPVGIGIMGFQDALYKLRVPYATTNAVEFADRTMEAVSYFSIKASSNLAELRGTYPSYAGSLWSQGIFPIDSLELLKKSRRDKYFDVNDSKILNWDKLRDRVKTVGMRNSNTMAIAPTATISNICGVSQSIEPIYQNVFVKSNLSGEFIVVNPYLVSDLKGLGIWDSVMVNDLKYYDGSVQNIDRIPDDLKELYTTAFELDSRWLIEAASRRQKWIDQGQSLNLYMANPDGKKLDELYKLSWVKGLKTTYYLRSMGATHMEKNNTGVESEPKVCSIIDPECDACE